MYGTLFQLSSKSRSKYSYLGRRGLPKPMSLPRQPSTVSNATPSTNCSTSDMRSTASKAFSTPYRLRKTDPDAEHGTAARRQLKRPLLACVPFGKKLKLESEEKQQCDAVSGEMLRNFLS